MSQMKRFKGPLLPVLMGCGLGLLFCLARALPLFLNISIPESGRHFAEMLNAPALELAHLWSTVVRLPPSRGLGRWLAVPCGMILVQWTLLGWAAGRCWGWGTARKATHTKRQQP
jgi:hypothetical protein